MHHLNEKPVVAPQSRILQSMVILSAFAIAMSCAAQSSDQPKSFVLGRQNRTIVIEPYGPNIVRITMGADKLADLANPGYGIVGVPSLRGWTHEQDSSGYDIIRSAQLVVHIAPETQPAPHPMPLDSINQSLRDRYFGSLQPRYHPANDTISITTASGKSLMTMWSWIMAPNNPVTNGSPAATEGKISAHAYPQPSTLPQTNTITGSVSSNRVRSICATTASTAGTTIPPSEARMCAFPS